MGVRGNEGITRNAYHGSSVLYGVPSGTSSQQKVQLKRCYFDHLFCFMETLSEFISFGTRFDAASIDHARIAGIACTHAVVHCELQGDAQNTRARVQSGLEFRDKVVLLLVPLSSKTLP